MPTVREIADRLGAELTGPCDGEITGVAGVREAGPSDITFVSDPRYSAAAKDMAAGAVVVARDWTGETNAAVIRVDRVDTAFADIAGWLAPPPPRRMCGLPVCLMSLRVESFVMR